MQSKHMAPALVITAIRCDTLLLVFFRFYVTSYKEMPLCQIHCYGAEFGDGFQLCVTRRQERIAKYWILTTGRVKYTSEGLEKRRIKTNARG